MTQHPAFLLTQAGGACPLPGPEKGKAVFSRCFTSWGCGVGAGAHQSQRPALQLDFGTKENKLGQGLKSRAGGGGHVGTPWRGTAHAKARGWRGLRGQCARRNFQTADLPPNCLGSYLKAGLHEKTVWNLGSSASKPEA